jgi:hypothetical protein
MRPLEISPEEFHHLLGRASRLAEDYLASLDERPVFPQTSGEETQQRFATRLPQDGMGAAAFDELPELFRLSRANNGRFFGYVQGSGEAVAIIAELLASAVNQNITAWRSAPAAVTIERTVVAWLAEAVGCTGFTGSLTGGGSSANLMGLAMARQQKGADLGRATLYASAEAHMSIAKAAALLGLPRENIRTIRVDREFKMRLDDLESALGADVAAGRIPVAIVATAGAVNTGAIDPIKDIAAAARRHGVLTEAWRRSPIRRNSSGWIRWTRSPSIRTNGSISRWIAVVFCSATANWHARPFRIPATMPGCSPVIRSRASPSLTNHWNSRVASAP